MVNIVGSSIRIILYSIIFVLLSVILRVLGLFTVGTLTIFSFAMLFSGLGLTYIHFGRKNPFILFSSVFVFLLGFLFYLIDQHVFSTLEGLWTPSFLLIIGFGFLMLFFEDIKERLYGGLAAFFLIASITLLLIRDRFSISIFFPAVIGIIKMYGLVIVALIGLIWIIIRNERKN